VRNVASARVANWSRLRCKTAWWVSSRGARRRSRIRRTRSFRTCSATSRSRAPIKCGPRTSVCPDGARLRVPGGDHRLVLAHGAVVAAVEHDGRQLLCRRARRGAASVWHAGDLQHRSGVAIHRREFHRRARSRRRADQHGRQRLLARQRVRRTTVALGQIRRRCICTRTTTCRRRGAGSATTSPFSTTSAPTNLSDTASRRRCTSDRWKAVARLRLEQSQHQVSSDRSRQQEQQSGKSRGAPQCDRSERCEQSAHRAIQNDLDDCRYSHQHGDDPRQDWQDPEELVHYEHRTSICEAPGRGADKQDNGERQRSSRHPRHRQRVRLAHELEIPRIQSRLAAAAEMVDWGHEIG
jgi:hypothetical protein